MYNARQKTSFLKSYTQSISTARVATTVFNAFEPYETAWGADLSTRSKEELQPVLEKVLGLRTSSQGMSLTILREYVKWCLLTKTPDACDAMLHTEVLGLSKIRRQMVSSPLHLQKSLDEVFESENENTIDITYRCYYWMAFAGIYESDTLSVKNSDINFTEMEINYRDTHVPIYREALPTFRKAVELQSFIYIHPNYNNKIWRNRIPGDTIMRGVRAETRILAIRAVTSRTFAAALDSGKTTHQLSFRRAWMSGLFYRMYERERAGLPVDFTEAAVEFADHGDLLNRSRSISRNTFIANKKKEYMEDYQRWKIAFSI